MRQAHLSRRGLAMGVEEAILVLHRLLLQFYK
jgi:electron transfer flavoprotein alpha/beta subunit